MSLSEEIQLFVTSFPSGSSETKRGYRNDLKIFQSWLDKAAVSLEDVRPTHIRSFALWLHSQKSNFKTGVIGLSAASVNRRLACLKSFFEYLIEEGKFLDPNPVRKRHFLPISKRLPRPIATQQLIVLLGGISHVRDKALFLMYLESGMRLRELLALNESDLQLERCSQENVSKLIGKFLIKGKGDKERIVYVSNVALQAYLDYLKTRPNGSNGLFVGRSGNRMTAINVQKRLTFWCKKLELKGIHLHRLRHTYATKLVENGMRIEHLAELMGHSNINTTKKYVLVSPESVREAFLQSTSGNGRSNHDARVN